MQFGITYSLVVIFFPLLAMVRIGNKEVSCYQENLLGTSLHKNYNPSAKPKGAGELVANMLAC
jgi:hypothetical protein